MMSVVETYICQDCKELTDALIGERGKIFNRKHLTVKQKKDFYCCGRCGSSNIKIWNPEERPCPKCGAKLSKPDMPDIMWD